MRGPKPPAIALTEAERAALDQLVRRHTTPQQLALRGSGFRRCRRQIAWLQEDLRRYSEIEDRGEFFKALGRIAVQQRIMQRLKSGEVDEGMKR